MLRIIVTAAALAFVAPGLALAHMCPALMAEIDAVLETAELSAEDRARVEELRAEGEALHEAGEHDASVAALEEAKAILGI